MEENKELALLLVNFMKKMVSSVRHPSVEDKEMKLTSHAFNALWILDIPRENSMTMTALAEEMGISGQQLTKLINELEGRQLVLREHDRKNRRLVHVKITREGQAFLQTHINRMCEALSERLQKLTTGNQKRLADSIRTLDEVMDILLQL